ncbi:hypothetical protein B0H15DRAFT_444736 [Mycena belliarum]|uniref:Uncharacterized protein n=1 Tax=Mycena belliarum TaxID=1033014 RepID=A0AAD6XIT6_9AGAR|nr:hypothetical protein B0H15DRAFT_444736 [Mycena belliae]
MAGAGMVFRRQVPGFALISSAPQTFGRNLASDGRLTGVLEEKSVIPRAGKCRETASVAQGWPHRDVIDTQGSHLLALTFGLRKRWMRANRAAIRLTERLTLGYQLLASSHRDIDHPSSDLSSTLILAPLDTSTSSRHRVRATPVPQDTVVANVPRHLSARTYRPPPPFLRMRPTVVGELHLHQRLAPGAAACEQLVPAPHIRLLADARVEPHCENTRYPRRSLKTAGRAARARSRVRPTSQTHFAVPSPSAHCTPPVSSRHGRPRSSAGPAQLS